MAPVVQTEGNVTILLNFKHHDVVTQGVNCPRWYKNTVAGLRGEAGETIRQRAVGHSLAQVFGSGARPQAGINPACCRCLQHYPCFGLWCLPRGYQIHIRCHGMHLDREHFMGVEELQQQGESEKAMGRLSH